MLFWIIMRIAVDDTAGQCPPIGQGVVGICEEQCSTHYDCAGSQICCTNGCGHVCTEPIDDDENSTVRDVAVPIISAVISAAAIIVGAIISVCVYCGNKDSGKGSISQNKTPKETKYSYNKSNEGSESGDNGSVGATLLELGQTPNPSLLPVPDDDEYVLSPMNIFQR